MLGAQTRLLHCDNDDDDDEDCDDDDDDGDYYYDNDHDYDDGYADHVVAEVTGRHEPLLGRPMELVFRELQRAARQRDRHLPGHHHLFLRFGQH